VCSACNVFIAITLLWLCMRDTWILHAMDVGDSDLPAVKHENVDVGLFSFSLIGKCFVVLTCDIRSFLPMHQPCCTAVHAKMCQVFTFWVRMAWFFYDWTHIPRTCTIMGILWTFSSPASPFWIIMVARIMLVMFCCIVDISRLWLLFQYHHYTRNKFEGLSGC
jgi:hypothetical protein